MINWQDKNQLICNFLLRDIIENIKLYLYFIRGDKKEVVWKNEDGIFTREENIDSITEKINAGLRDGNKDWGFSTKEIINNNTVTANALFAKTNPIIFKTFITIF